jgi:hypothetical protein
LYGFLLCRPWLESLEIAQGRFRKFNSKYIESIQSARGISPPRNTNFPHWVPSSECLWSWSDGRHEVKNIYMFQIIF